MIKGDAAQEAIEGLVPGFSASGQDVWLTEPLYQGPGLVLSAVGARCGKVFEADGCWGVVANTSVLIPQPGFEAHYLWYIVNNEEFWEKGGTAQPYVRVPETLERRISFPPLGEQRAIADFLDARTTMIDALITKKRRMIDLLEERRWVSFLKRVQAAHAPRVPLRRGLLAITDGPFGSAFRSDEYSEEGVAVIRLGNIGFAAFRERDLAHLPSGRFNEFRRYQVRKDDVLFAGLGDDRNHAGRACVAPELGAAIVKGKCFCARLDLRRADPDYVALYFSSPVGAESVAVGARGSTRSMINLEIVKSVELPMPSVERQHEIAMQTRQEWSTLENLRVGLSAQLTLLREHRQTLITAVVTGNIEIQEQRIEEGRRVGVRGVHLRVAGRLGRIRRHEGGDGAGGADGF